jgi:hypothetical protein
MASKRHKGYGSGKQRQKKQLKVQNTSRLDLTMVDRMPSMHSSIVVGTGVVANNGAKPMPSDVGN